MYGALVKLYLIATAIQFGITLTNMKDCSGIQCLKKIEQATHEVLKIDWKPISMFPNEAKWTMF